ncbi:MAG TPA: S49 family peptidase, partial [Paenirhodobacter sp.]
DMHVSFKDWVVARRGTRLVGDDLFTGELWTGRQAIATGLIDGLGHAVPKLKALYGDKVRLIPYGQKRSLLRRFGATFGADAADAVIATAEERTARARYGL